MLFALDPEFIAMGEHFSLRWCSKFTGCRWGLCSTNGLYPFPTPKWRLGSWLMSLGLMSPFGGLATKKWMNPLLFYSLFLYSCACIVGFIALVIRLEHFWKHSTIACLGISIALVIRLENSWKHLVFWVPLVITRKKMLSENSLILL